METYLDHPLPHIFYFSDEHFPMGYVHCDEMDIFHEIVEEGGEYFLACSGGLSSFSLQVQKKITKCPGCGEKLELI